MDLRGALARVRRVAGEPAALRLEQRVAAMNTSLLVSWGETAISGLGRAYSDFQGGNAGPGGDPLNDARITAASLCVVLDEIEARRRAGVL